MEIKYNSNAKKIASGIIPFIFVIILMAYLFGPGYNLINFGVILPEVTIEKVEFVKSEIHVTIRNTGQMPVDIAMADVNDRIQPAAIEPHKSLSKLETALVRIPYEWNEGEPYTIGITTHEGTRFEKKIDAAAPTLNPTIDQIQLFSIVGTYVGIVPILIGLAWLPFIKIISKNKYQFFLALTVGLLIFLGIDAIKEGLEASTESLSSNFNGPLLISTTVLISFLVLYYAGEKLSNRNSAGISKPLAVGLMIAIGIGLHNFGEGLAIGAAVVLGEVALSTFLIVGFALHNTTEGIAIAAPMAKERRSILKLLSLGLIAGAPAIFGTWVGGFSYSPFTSILFLSVGAGAIFQVVVVVLKWIHEQDKKLSTMPVISGISVGMIIMYVTSIFI